ncbi:MAG TPA: hypothetical protein VMH61_04935 [Candidatus Acidoferrales bacterium]|nr:hypothetical protein [Candidatus Acidoferrales bacterium]
MSVTPGGMGSGAPTPARQATMREFFAVFFRRRGIILGLFLVVTATVLVIALTTPALFVSSGKVLITRGERESELNGRVQVLNEWEPELASEVAKVHSSPVIQRARSLLAARFPRTGIAPDTLNPKSVDVEVMGKSNVLEIGYADLSPRVAHEVCDAVITAYVQVRQERSESAADSSFGAAMRRIDAQIESRLGERERLAGELGVLEPVEQSRQWASQLSALEIRRDETAAELADAETAQHAMEEMQKLKDIDLPTITSSLYTDEAALVSLKQKITDQETRIATLRERYQDDSPEVQNALSTLETLQALLHKEVDGRLALTRTRVSMLQARLVVHDRDIASLRERLERLPASEKRMSDLDNEVADLRLSYKGYSEARDQARITASTSELVMVSLLNPAGPAERQNTRDLVRLGLAPAFSLVVGIGLAFFVDGLDVTVRTPTQAEEFLDLPVLATLSERKSRRG